VQGEKDFLKYYSCNFKSHVLIVELLLIESVFDVYNLSLDENMA
jgi:hypothetical protein